jgi:hypothetical protein
MRGMNGFMKGLWVVGALLLASCSVGGDGNGDEVCTQVVVFARPASGGNCSSYPTPCDVPDGYVQCCGGFVGGCAGRGTSVKCVDDPTDTCDPKSGGADCPGICQ